MSELRPLVLCSGRLGRLARTWTGWEPRWALTHGERGPRSSSRRSAQRAACDGPRSALNTDLLRRHSRTTQHSRLKCADSKVCSIFTELCNHHQPILPPAFVKSLLEHSHRNPWTYCRWPLPCPQASTVAGGTLRPVTERVGRPCCGQASPRQLRLGLWRSRSCRGIWS